MFHTGEIIRARKPGPGPKLLTPDWFWAGAAESRPMLAVVARGIAHRYTEGRDPRPEFGGQSSRSIKERKCPTTTPTFIRRIISTARNCPRWMRGCERSKPF